MQYLLVLKFINHTNHPRVKELRTKHEIVFNASSNEKTVQLVMEEIQSYMDRAKKRVLAIEVQGISLHIEHAGEIFAWLKHHRKMKVYDQETFKSFFLEKLEEQQ